jgi:hypothetical protein
MTVVAGCRSGLMGCSFIGSCSVFVGGGDGGRHVYTVTRKEKKRKEKKTVRTFRNRVPIIGYNRYIGAYFSSPPPGALLFR